MAIAVLSSSQPRRGRGPGSSIPSSALALLVGVLLLQLGFIFSYVAAFHDPHPHNIPIAVVAPEPVAARVVTEINASAGHVGHAGVATGATAAQGQLKSGTISAALLVNVHGRTDRLLYAEAGGASVASAVQEIATRAEASQHRRVTFTDVVPLQPGDGRGLTGFYLVIGWVVGGYLMAAALGTVLGPHPASRRLAELRLATIVPYALLSGLFGVLIVEQLLHALSGHFLELWGLGTLVVAAAAAATMAVEALIGVAGIGVVVLAFVILGNPSAGGAYQTTMLPGFWRAISGWLPNGAGTDSVRRIVYFGSHGVTGHLLVLALYVVAGAGITLARSPAIRGGFRGR
jgi:hypothetical protein